jgi:hypothetical protein
MKNALLASLSLFVCLACDKQRSPSPEPVVVADGGSSASGLKSGVGQGGRGSPDVKKWFTSCGDPVCGGYSGPFPGVPACGGNQEGQACATEGATCDFQSSCNAVLVCAKQDPKQQPGGCPISRARFKRDIAYLDAAKLEHYYEDLGELKLATWRYREASDQRTHLGLILEDAEPGAVWADPAHDRVDLYGYTSLAIAGVQAQAREIEELQASLAALRSELDELRTRCGQ